MRSSLLALALVGAPLALAGTTTRPAQSTIEPSLSQIEATQATQAALSPASNVKGVAFNRIVQIWLENTDYQKAANDPNMQFLAQKGITLTNYFGVTHPSEPNYAAVVAGDDFGMQNDDFIAIPSNISTVVDLLDTKGISWGEYQEGSPYAGFQGFNYSNQVTFNNSYVRKHNPLILFDSVTSNATRLSLIKNFTSFTSDLNAKTLPQWSFITPNMTNDGHDTTIAFAASWARGFLEPLLNDSYFMQDTLVVLTFDEVETYKVTNKVFAVLLGGAIPSKLVNTTDNTFYSHYSMISTVSANWGLPSLGRWDCGANVLALVANKTGYTNAVIDTTNLYFNSSYPGALNDVAYQATWPVPDTSAKCANGLGVLQSIQTTWGQSNGTYNYTSPYSYDSVSGTNNVANAVISAASSSSSSSSSSPSSSATSTKTTAAQTSSTSASPTSSKSSEATALGRSLGLGGVLAGAAVILIL